MSNRYEPVWDRIERVILDEMKKQGISMIELGKRLHKNRNSVARIIHNTRYSSLDKINEICQELGIHLSDVLENKYA